MKLNIYSELGILVCLLVILVSLTTWRYHQYGPYTQANLFDLSPVELDLRIDSENDPTKRAALLFRAVDLEVKANRFIPSRIAEKYSRIYADEKLPIEARALALFFIAELAHTASRPDILHEHLSLEQKSFSATEQRQLILKKAYETYPLEIIQLVLLFDKKPEGRNLSSEDALKMIEEVKVLYDESYYLATLIPITHLYVAQYLFEQNLTTDKQNGYEEIISLLTNGQDYCSFSPYVPVACIEADMIQLRKLDYLLAFESEDADKALEDLLSGPNITTVAKLIENYGLLEKNRYPAIEKSEMIMQELQNI